MRRKHVLGVCRIQLEATWRSARRRANSVSWCGSLQASRVSIGHHQTSLPSSFPSRRAALTWSEAWATASRTFWRFSSGVAAVSKYQFKSGCLRGCNSDRTTLKPASGPGPAKPFVAGTDRGWGRATFPPDVATPRFPGHRLARCHQ